MDLLTTEYVHPKAILAFTKVIMDYAAGKLVSVCNACEVKFKYKLLTSEFANSF